MKNGTATLEGSITFAQTGAVAKYDETTTKYSRDVAAFAADPEVLNLLEQLFQQVEQLYQLLQQQLVKVKVHGILNYQM